MAIHSPIAIWNAHLDIGDHAMLSEIPHGLAQVPATGVGVDNGAQSINHMRFCIPALCSQIRANAGDLGPTKQRCF